MRFKDKNIVITGATSGIGAATALLFAEEGANVILVGRNEERGQRIAEQALEKKRGSAEFYSCDVSFPEEVDILKNQVEAKYGYIDILFNNAGVFKTSDLTNLQIVDWEQTFRTNVDGVMYMTKSFIGLLQDRHGCIINNASVSGLDSFTSGPKNYMYGASKAAQIKFSKLCALNYAADVRVNVICPGIIDTEIYENRDFSRFDGVIPMGYIAKPEEVAKVVLFLASEDAKYITGAVIPIDGGMSLK